MAMNIQKPRTKSTHQNLNPKQERPLPNSNYRWDCDSNLYDSFELKSFERQLSSAIHSRTFSMPHLHDAGVLETKTTAAAVAHPPLVSKKPSKISRSFNKFIKSVFKSKHHHTSLFRDKNRPGDEYGVVYDKSGALTTIPEVPEIDFNGFSPEINSLVRRGGSERFTETSMVGISCAH